MRQFKAGLSPGWIKSASLADVDPFRSRQLHHHIRRNSHRRIGGARCRNYLVIVFKRYVAKYGKRRGQSEGANAADGMAGHDNHLFRSQHARLGPEMIAEFAVIEPFSAGGDDEKDGVTRFQADRFGDLVGIDTVCFRSQCKPSPSSLRFR